MNDHKQYEDIYAYVNGWKFPWWMIIKFIFLRINHCTKHAYMLTFCWTFAWFLAHLSWSMETWYTRGKCARYSFAQFFPSTCALSGSHGGSVWEGRGVYTRTYSSICRTGLDMEEGVSGGMPWRIIVAYSIQSETTGPVQTLDWTACANHLDWAVDTTVENILLKGLFNITWKVWSRHWISWFQGGQLLLCLLSCIHGLLHVATWQFFLLKSLLILF